MPGLRPIGVKIELLVALSSWPGLSGPSLSAPAATDGPDKPGHDGVATIVLPARYFDAYGACARHDEVATTVAKLTPIPDKPGESRPQGIASAICACSSGHDVSVTAMPAPLSWWRLCRGTRP